MDEEIVKTLNMMEIEVVIIKGKIPGIKSKVEIIMDPETFREWRKKIKAKEAPKQLTKNFPIKKMGFGKALMGEIVNLVPKKKS